MGKVRFIQEANYKSTFTCGLYRPNFTFYLVDESDNVLYTLEETTSKFIKFMWTTDLTPYHAVLYKGMKGKKLVQYAKPFRIPSWFWNYKRPEVTMKDWESQTDLGIISNPVGKWWSCKAYMIEVKNTSGEMIYQVFADKWCELNLWWPLPFWKFKQTQFKIQFPENALFEGETLEMKDHLDLNKTFGGCTREWWGSSVIFEFNTISTWNDIDYARLLGALHLMTMIYFND